MNHHEKPDTIFSIDDDEKVEEIKIQLLKAKIQCAQCDIHSDNIVNGDNFFDELMELINEKSIINLRAIINNYDI